MVRRTVARRRGGARRITRRNQNTGSSMQFVPNKSRMGLVMDQLITTRMYRIANVSVTAASFAGAYDFRLNYLPQSGEFTALFDAYKIWKVDIQFIPKYNSSDFSTGGAGFGLPTMYVAEDRNDVNPPASINELMEYNTCKAQRFDRPFHYTCWPTLASTGAVGFGVVIDERQKDLYLRTLEPAVSYWGVKWGLDLPIGLETFRMDVVFKYYLKLKDVK